MSQHRITVQVNGEAVRAEVEARLTLADFLRQNAGRTGVHIGCEHGVCGACTIMLEGQAVRACLMLAVQADGAAVTTVEGLADIDGPLHPVQQAMQEEYGLQCGFCTPGVVMTLASLTDGSPPASAATLRAALSGHICRCTGYQGMLRAAARLGATTGADA
jgi:carbon-monoxide dehydrogenase small subunit